MKNLSPFATSKLYFFILVFPIKANLAFLWAWSKLDQSRTTVSFFSTIFCTFWTPEPIKLIELVLCFADNFVFFFFSKLILPLFSISFVLFQSTFLSTSTIFSTVFILSFISCWTCFCFIPFINNLFSLTDFNTNFGFLTSFTSFFSFFSIFSTFSTFSIFFIFDIKLNWVTLEGINICSLVIWIVWAGPSFKIIPLFPSKSNPLFSICNDSLNFFPLSEIFKAKLSISNSSFSFSTTTFFSIPFTFNFVVFIGLISSFQFLYTFSSVTISSFSIIFFSSGNFTFS